MTNKDKVYKLLKGIETGDADAASVVNEGKYIQHNPHTREGSIGLAELFKQLSKTGPKVQMIRVFEDKDFVFAHMLYDFSSIKVTFEVFRFEDGFAVEHWDNLQPIADPNPSGHTMLDGATMMEDRHLTEPNRQLVQCYVNDVLINHRFKLLYDYLDETCFTQHNPAMSDDVDSIRETLTENDAGEHPSIFYHKVHRILAEGNFVLAICEGEHYGKPSSIYDLYRLSGGKIVEHWDTITPIPPKSEWKNNNGKF